MAKPNVDAALLERVAKNARLKLSESEKKKFLPQLQEIINSFSKLSEVDVSQEKPSFQPIELKNVWREDKIGKCVSREEALSLTEHKKDSYYKGPKVV